MITEREAADRLGVALVTLRRWRYQGIAPRHVIYDSGAVRYYPRDVDEHKARRTGGRR